MPVSEFEGEIGGDILHDDVAEMVVVLAELPKRGALDHKKLGIVGNSLDAGRAGSHIDECHFAENLPLAEIDNGARCARWVWVQMCDFDETLIDDEEFFAGFALPGDEFPRFTTAPLADGGDHLKLLWREAFEQFDGK